MIKLEIDGRKIGETNEAQNYRGCIKEWSVCGPAELLMAEMGVALSQLLGEIIGGYLAEKGEEDFEASFELANDIGKTIMLSGVVDATMKWAEEHSEQVDVDDLVARVSRGLDGNATERFEKKSRR